MTEHEVCVLSHRAALVALGRGAITPTATVVHLGLRDAKAGALSQGPALLPPALASHKPFLLDASVSPSGPGRVD